MVREDLIEGAISFLQDPSVATAPVEQRIAFLRSKNLTQEEIDTSLARVGQAAPASSPPVQYQPAQQQFQQRPPPQQYGGYQQNPQQYWQQPPPEPPQRDWRDYFIAATVIGSASYGIYWTAKRYILPLIAPPTPPQLESDKASIDASFDKAFALLDQLATDTADLKSAEAARKERLDVALGEVESVLARMKSANDEREIEAKRIAREMQELRDLVPKALEKEKGVMEGRLGDLVGEVKSLKTLVGNRVGGAAAPAAARTTPAFANPSSAPKPATAEEEKPAPETNGSSTPASTTTPSAYTAPVYPPANSTATTSQAREIPGGSQTPYSRLLDRGGKGSGGGAAIPSWQLAAKKKSEEAKAAETNGTNGTTESGTATEMVDAAT
ncbi:related to PEROXISOMAL MEMBRANE PROTEIN PER10 [Ramularia collo-cygni]|uniref:Peroxisomal membrane protein PEX14 n=1 Tax=Ramularia collo-cygni TaxID=112498 RepID=A0A2D3UM00_9PEZI|nr:related to PEROXISOMAL MEMBRANE PROTEIN PER10 [Ramularia collo-cygni]CZT15812.1 related to PEROXISOMAL MEMBRANE PROTEIN PER10 [Ramularia collo-cygni]